MFVSFYTCLKHTPNIAAIQAVLCVSVLCKNDCILYKTLKNICCILYLFIL